MSRLINGLITQDNTFVEHEDDFKFTAPHHFVVKSSHTHEVLCKVDFQEGALKEAPQNGVFNEDLIAMVICRLQNFQNSEFSCRENAMAITKLEESLMWLRKRTQDRQSRNVLGTSNK